MKYEYKFEVCSTQKKFQERVLNYNGKRGWKAIQIIPREEYVEIYFEKKMTE